jgi:hypothetical protein
MILSSEEACRNHGDTQKTQNKLKGLGRYVIKRFD